VPVGKPSSKLARPAESRELRLEGITSLKTEQLRQQTLGIPEQD
jgi:hypothetical protein